MEKTSLPLKLDSRIKKALEDLATKENRASSNKVVTFLIRHLGEKGIYWKKAKK